MRTSRASSSPAIAIAVLALIASAPRFAAAHAFPSSEKPAAGSTLTVAPVQVDIHFDNPIEALFAKLQVSDKSGADMASSTPAVSDDRLVLSVKLKPLAAGDYSVKWSVVAEDSHRSEGSYSFTVAGSHD
jgi:copper resistance protein C